MKYLTLISACAIGVLAAIPYADASIYGTMSNFDTYNETETDSYGAEIELEGIDIEDISRTFPSHYDHESFVAYAEGAVTGTRIIYDGYNFSPTGYLPANTVGVSTNGHSCVGTAGCEHFGFSVTGIQPTAARFYWLDIDGNRIGSMPEMIAMPNWSYAGGGGGQPRLVAEVHVPEPPELHELKPDSVWMKVFKTEIDRPVDLLELMSDNAIIPDDIGETETEWELLEGGLDKMDEAEDDVPEDHYAVIRRYEFYEYTGPYDDENEPLSIFLDQDLPEPPEGELGQFISANMVAANLAAPLEGDFNQDEHVDGHDFLAWQRGYGHGKQLIEGDGNWDDEVDEDDLAIWAGQFGGELEHPDAVRAVPEPTTFLLAALGMLLLTTTRKQTGVA